MRIKIVVFFVLLSSVVGFSKNPDVADPWTQFVREEGEGWRVRFHENGDVAAMFGRSAARSATAVEATGDFLLHYHGLFGMKDLSTLRLEKIDTGKIGKHVTYQQYWSGYRVVGAEIGIHVNQRNEVIAASSSYHPFALPSPPANIVDLRTDPQTAWQRKPELVILPVGESAKYAWEILAEGTDPSRGPYLYYRDAERPYIVLRSVELRVAARRPSGKVWLENPIVTPSRKRVLFKYLVSFSLDGIFAKTFNAMSRFAVPFRVDLIMYQYTTATSGRYQFDYEPNDPRVAEAMAYYHITKISERWAAYGYRVQDRQTSVFVNAAAFDSGPCLDNAFYRRQLVFNTGSHLVFGCGDQLENLGWDADVYYHEYGHSILDHVKPQLLSVIDSVFPRSLHEGFGDFVAASINDNPAIAEFGLRRKTGEFQGRNVANNNRFPNDVHDPELKEAEVHHTGLIPGGVLWDLRAQIGAEKTETMLLEALRLLPTVMTFFDFRDAMITADEELNRGIHRTAIESSFAQHGLSGRDPGQKGNVHVTELITAVFDSEEGVLKQKSIFQRGDTILVLAGYSANKVTPGYNLVADDGVLKGPKPSSTDTFLVQDDVVNGEHRGIRGIVQARIFTSSSTVPGQYTISIRSRLGGQSKPEKKQSVTFTIE